MRTRAVQRWGIIIAGRGKNRAEGQRFKQGGDVAASAVSKGRVERVEI